ncbi:MAG: trigger factor [Erysipelotrichaceae bacterium]|nr:trigger factor [Erysipelotrichaceae bacterium]
MSKVTKLGKYKGIEVTVAKTVATTEEVNQEIEKLLSQNPLLLDKDGVVENGDVTLIDFEGLKDGIAFDGGTAKGYTLEIGSHAFIEGFEEKMIGMKVGETRDLDLTFPANYQASDLAGQDVIFKVTVHKIQTKQDASLNDEFVQSLSIQDVSNVEQFKQYMKAYVQSKHDDQYRTNVENALFQELLNDCEVEIEDQDIELAMQEQLDQISYDLSRQGMTLDAYLQMMGASVDMLKEQLKPSSQQQAKFEAIIDAIIIVEAISTTDEEIDEQFDMMAKQNNVSVEQVEAQVSREGFRHDFNRVKSSQLVIQSAIIHN